MKLRATCLTLLATVACWLPARAADGPIDFLPEDTSGFFSYTKKKDAPPIEEHPVYKALATPALKKAFAPLLSQLAQGEEHVARIWKEETGLTLEQVQALMDGTVAVGVRAPIARIMESFSKNFGQGRDGESPFDLIDVIGAAHFSGDEALAEKVMGTYLRIMKETTAIAAEKNPAALKFPELESSTENYDGIKLHLLKPKAGESSFLRDPGWAYLDKMIVFATSEKALRSSLDLARKGGSTLAKSPRYAALDDKAKNSAVIYYLDLQNTVGQLVKKFLADRPPAEPGQLDPAAIVSALGIEKFDSVYFAGDLKDDALVADIGLTFHDKPGLMSLMTIDGPGKVPDFLPPNAASSSYGTVHLDRMMTAIENIVKEAFPPGAAALSTQLDEIKQKTGVDVKKDFLGNLGPDIWTVTGDMVTSGKLSNKLPGDLALPEVPTQPQIFGVRVKDKKAFQLALSSIINWAAPDQALFEEREYRGYTIRTVKGLPMPIGYVLNDDWIIFNVGPETLLEDVLGRLKAPGGNHLFSLPKIQAALATFPPGEDSTSYLDFGNMLQTITTLFRQLPDMDVLKPILDLQALPENLNLNLIILSRAYLDDHGYRVHLRLEEKSK